MITIFNRREIRLTRDLDEYFNIRRLLDENNIEFTVRIPGKINQDRYHGIPGINMKYMYEYHIYVNKKDFDRAQRVLQTY